MNRTAHRAAQVISTAGHPALITSASGLAALAARGADPATLRLAAIAIVAVALVVLGFGWVQVRRGAWGHIDASRPQERRSHNAVALLVLGAGAVGAWAAGGPMLAAGLAAAAAVIAVAVLLSGRLKLSQHTAFAALSAVIAASAAPLAGAAGLGFVGLMAWSRLKLGRHTLAEVSVGAVVGLLAGLALFLVAPGA